jgi:uncharacterized membrane protein
MNDKLMGIIYLALGILIIVVYLVAPNFFVILLWIIAIVAIIAGIYLIFLKKGY